MPVTMEVKNPGIADGKEAWFVTVLIQSIGVPTVCDLSTYDMLCGHVL